jgi:diguanylate cyclase (GGDEF)-like protein
MKRNLLNRAYLILAVAATAMAACVYLAGYAISRAEMSAHIGEMAARVSEYARANADAAALEALKETAGLKRLYLAKEDEQARLTLVSEAVSGEAGYKPEGQLSADLLAHLRGDPAVRGGKVYATPEGRVYAVIWPAESGEPGVAGAMCAEIDVERAYGAQGRAAGLCLAISGGVLAMTLTVSYFWLSNATEPLLKRLAYTDILTGCENRLSFEQRVSQYEEHAARGARISMLAFDLNTLPGVNAEYGHKVGDSYLRKSAGILAEHLGENAALFRTGGHEFAAIVADCEEKRLQAILEGIAEESREAAGGLKFQCVFGGAVYKPGFESSLKDTLSRAETALNLDRLRKQPAGQETE